MFHLLTDSALKSSVFYFYHYNRQHDERVIWISTAVQGHIVGCFNFTSLMENSQFISVNECFISNHLSSCICLLVQSYGRAINMANASFEHNELLISCPWVTARIRVGDPQLTPLSRGW